jgi:hypothetical protein
MQSLSLFSYLIQWNSQTTFLSRTDLVLRNTLKHPHHPALLMHRYPCAYANIMMSEREPAVQAAVARCSGLLPDPHELERIFEGPAGACSWGGCVCAAHVFMCECQTARLEVEVKRGSLSYSSHTLSCY